MADQETARATPFKPTSITDIELIQIETMWSILPLLSLSALLVPVQSLYFYIDGSQPKCFFEELPKDTLVVGKYVAEEFDDNTKQWSKHDGLNIFITVDVCPIIQINPQLNHILTSSYRKYSTMITAS